MKRLFPTLSLCAFVIFGTVLLFQMATPPIPIGWKIVAGQGTLHWNPRTKEIILRQYSDYLVLDQGPQAIGDFQNFTVVKDNPEASTLIRVMTGNPTVLFGKLKSEGQLSIINPNGMIVGQNAGFDFTSHVSSGVRITPNVRELKAYGNVYALAINREGKVRAARSGGSVMIVNPKVTIPAPVIVDETK